MIGEGQTSRASMKLRKLTAPERGERGTEREGNMEVLLQ